MKYPPRSPQDIVALIDANPLCWVVSNGAEGFGATPLPLLTETDANGVLTSLFGHFAINNPQVAQLRAAPSATILVTGPNAYISPALVAEPTWVPTWNYAMAKIDVEIAFVPDETRDSVERLTNRMEAGQATPWQVADTGQRLESMLRRIIAFRAHVVSTDGRFKLGRDERPETLEQIMGGLQDKAVVDWMALYNSDRIGAE